MESGGGLKSYTCVKRGGRGGGGVGEKIKNKKSSTPLRMGLLPLGPPGGWPFPRFPPHLPLIPASVSPSLEVLMRRLVSGGRGAVPFMDGGASLTSVC